MKIKFHQLLFVWMLCVSLTLAVPVCAADSKARIPSKAYSYDQSCKVLLDITMKYKIEGVFPKEFEEGKQCLTRIELAAALNLLEEKLAEKVLREGVESISTEDLERLSEIEGDLRSEMIIVRTKTFQTRNEGLGTTLHPLTKNISMSGGLVGFFQNSVGNKQMNDAGTVVGRGDLVFNFKVTDKTTAVIDIRAVGGKGIDSRIAGFSGLNAAGTDDGDSVRFRKAFIEHSMLDDRVVASIGKISLSDYFDTNNIANDENSQFLSGAFVNAASILFPTEGPGVRLHTKLSDSLALGLGYASSDGTGDNFTRNGFGITELDYKLKLGNLEGNYRVYGALEGAKPDGNLKMQAKTAYNAGISIDQQVSENLTLFARFSQGERNVYAASRAWAAGLQYCGLIPSRDKDILGIAYGQISGKGNYLPVQEKLLETYYSVKLHEKVSVAPVYQLLINPLGNRAGNYGSVGILGIRSLVTF